MGRVLVTGASGRVGLNLVAPLMKKGYHVRAFVLKNDIMKEKLKSMGCEIAEGNFLDEDSINEAVRGCDMVIHLGAVMIKPENMTETIYWNINVTGTFWFVRAAIREKVKRFVFISTDATYTPYNFKYLPIDEKHPQESYWFYGTSKIAGETIVKGGWYEEGLPVTIIRFGTVRSCDEILDVWCAGKVMKSLKKAATDPRTTAYREDVKEPWKPLEAIMEHEEQLLIPKGPDFRPWRNHQTDVRDSVQGVLLAIENQDAIGEAFNILGPGATTWEQAVKYLAEKTGQPYIECVLDNYIEWEISIEKAKRILGYKPQYDIYKMIDSALEYRNGKDIGVICPKLGYGFTPYNPLD